MWTAKITETRKNEKGFLEIVVEYTNGVETHQHTYTGINDDALLKIRIQDQIDFYEKQESYTPPVGDVELPVVTPEDPQLIADRNAFAKELTTLRRYQGAVALGFMNENDKLVTDLKAKLIADWRIEFLNLMPVV